MLDQLDIGWAEGLGAALDNLSRRDALKTVAAAAGAVGIATLPGAWEKTTVEASTLPRVSAASPEPFTWFEEGFETSQEAPQALSTAHGLLAPLTVPTPPNGQPLPPGWAEAGGPCNCQEWDVVRGGVLLPSGARRPDVRVGSSGSRYARFEAAMNPGRRLLYRIEPVDLSSAVSASLSFYIYHNSYFPAFVNDGIQVQVSDNGGVRTNVGPLFRRYRSDADGGPGWERCEIPLTGYFGVGKTSIRVGLLGTSVTGLNIFVDDVKLSGARLPG